MTSVDDIRPAGPVALLSQTRRLQLSRKVWLICQIFLLITAKVKKTKCKDPKWSPILVLFMVLIA